MNSIPFTDADGWTWLCNEHEDTAFKVHAYCVFATRCGEPKPERGRSVEALKQARWYGVYAKISS